MGVSSRTERSHHPGHCKGGLCRFGAAIVVFAKTTHLRLLLVFQEKDFVDHRHAGFDLDLHQRVADGLADMGCMDSLTPKNHTKADDRSRRRVGTPAGEFCGDHRDFKRTRDSHDERLLRACALQLCGCRVQQGVHIAGIVLGGENCKSRSFCAKMFASCFREHPPERIYLFMLSLAIFFVSQGNLKCPAQPIGFEGQPAFDTLRA